MRCLRPIEIFGVHMLTGIWLSRAGGVLSQSFRDLSAFCGRFTFEAG